MQQPGYRLVHGFSLIQISILLTVASIIMVAVLPTPQARVKNDAASVTRMNAIMLALRQYQAAYGVLPCPADPTQSVGSSSYGVAAANPGTTNNCTGGSPAAAYADSTNHIAIGMVPVTSLGLSYDYALDGYGRDITYAVDTNMTALSGSLCNSTILPGAITVNDNGNIHNSVVALVSHGQDGFGAWLPLAGTSGTASRLNTGSSNASQAANAQVAVGTLTPNTTFVSFVNQNTTSTFDDHVVYNSTQFNMNAMPQSYVGSSAYTTAYAANCVTCTPASGYSYCRIITIDHTKVGPVNNTDQTNFPLLFSGTYSYLATVANGGYVQNANGYDINFTSDSGGTTFLSYERELYTTSGAVALWVKIPTLSHTSDTTIYLHYGNAGATDPTNKTAVWDTNYKGVWHLAESGNGTAGEYKDSTNTNNLTGGNGTAAKVPTRTTGEIGYGQQFNTASNKFINNNAVTGLPNLSASQTVSTWYYIATNPGSEEMLIDLQYDNSDTKGNQTEFAGAAGNLMCESNATPAYIVHVSSNPAQATWHMVTWTWDGATNRLYVDGTQTATTATSPQSAAVNYLILGNYWLSGAIGSTPFGGILDEVEISNAARSADWIKTQYNNQSSPGTFYSISAASSR